MSCRGPMAHKALSCRVHGHPRSAGACVVQSTGVEPERITEREWPITHITVEIDVLGIKPEWVLRDEALQHRVVVARAVVEQPGVVVLAARVLERIGGRGALCR